MTVNKQWAKVTHDGVELSWNHEQDGPMTPEDVAKFYVDSVKALQKFKDEDPRTQPELRKADKERKEFRKDAWLVTKTVLVVLACAFAFAVCGSDLHPGY